MVTMNVTITNLASSRWEWYGFLRWHAPSGRISYIGKLEGGSYKTVRLALDPIRITAVRIGLKVEKIEVVERDPEGRIQNIYEIEPS